MPSASVPTLTVTSNFETLALQLDWTEDVWPSSTVTARVDIYRNSRWIPCLDMVRDRHTALQMKSRIFGLAESTTYPVRVNFIRTQDIDAEILESLTVSGSYTTRTPLQFSPTGTPVYISPTGSDSSPNDGSYALPFKSPVKASTVLTPGDYIVFKDGTYNRAAGYDFANATWRVSTNVVGTQSQPFGMRAENPGQAIIDGSKLLTGLTWTQHGAHTNIWWAPFTNAADFIDTDAATHRCPGVLRNELTGNNLLIYRYLEPTVTITNVTITSNRYVLTCDAADRPNTGLIFCLSGIDGTGNMEADLNRNGLRVFSTPSSTTFTVEPVSGTASGTYSSGGAMTPSNVPAMTQENLDLEGFIVDWDNERVYVRQKAARVLEGTAPASNEYSAAHYIGAGLAIISAQFYIVEGLKFKMWARLNKWSQVDNGAITPGIAQYTAVNANSNNCLRMDGGTDNVARNLIFDCAGLEQGVAMTRHTVEDCDFSEQDFCAKVFANPLDTEAMNRFNSQANNEIVPIAVSAGGQQSVIRRNRIAGAHHGVVGLSINGNDNSDWYENEFDSLTGKPFRFDSSGTPGNTRNAAIFHNVADKMSYFIDVSKYYSGPLWVIANKITNFWGAPWQKFANPPDGWFIDINNTFYSDIVNAGINDDVFDDQPHTYIGVGSTAVTPTAYGDGYELHVNSIYQANTYQYFTHGNSTVIPSPGLTFRTCAFYSPTTPSPTFELHAVTYATEALLLTHATSHGDVLTLDQNTYGVDPLPDGADGEPLASLPATYIRGITNIAAKSGVAYTGVGYFDGWLSSLPIYRSDRGFIAQPVRPCYAVSAEIEPPGYIVRPSLPHFTPPSTVGA